MVKIKPYCKHSREKRASVVNVDTLDHREHPEKSDLGNRVEEKLCLGHLDRPEGMDEMAKREKRFLLFE